MTPTPGSASPKAPIPTGWYGSKPEQLQSFRLARPAARKPTRRLLWFLSIVAPGIHLNATRGAEVQTMNAKSLLLAAALSATAVSPAWSGNPLPPPGSGGGLGPGPGIVAGSIISVLSVMVCAQYSCQTTNREMTSEDAIRA